MQRMTRARNAALFLAVSCVYIISSPLASPAIAEDALRGSFDLGYRYRSDGNETDQDATQRLSLDYFRPWAVLGKGAGVGLVLSGVLQEDLDDEAEEGVIDPFREIADSSDSNVSGWLYQAYLEFRGQGTLRAVKIGRQDNLELEPITFDGGLVGVGVGRKLTLTAYGGLPSNVYEPLEERDGDWLAGGYVKYRLNKKFAVWLGYLALRDKVQPLHHPETMTLENNLITLKALYNPMRGVSFSMTTTVLDDEVRNTSLRGSIRNTEYDYAVTAYYIIYYMEQEAAAIQVDAFALLLGTYQPYHAFGLTAYKGIGKYFGVEAGTTQRGLLDENDESLYNHSYQRYMGTIYIYKLPLKGSEWALGADWWIAPGTEIEAQSFRGEFTQKIGKLVKITAGTSYELFQVDTLTGTEDDNVRNYYASALFHVGKHLYIGADYRFEDGTIRELDTIKARLGYEF